MAIVVIGGHSRSVGKTSVVAGLIAALPELNWTAVKITQFGHGVCSQDAKPCDCSLQDEHSWDISEEQDRSGESDSSRFLVAGARRSLWVRTRQGVLFLAMPALRRELETAENVIIESNSILRLLRPDLYIPVLDMATADFKRTARDVLDRASAVILHEAPNEDFVPAWNGVSLKPVAGKPVFRVRPPEYVTPEIVEFVRERIAATRELSAKNR
jgi:hypothetical protein